MSSRVVRWFSVAVVAFAFSGFATAQEPPKKPEPKPEPKKEEPKKDAPKVDVKKEEKKDEKKAEGKDILATAAADKYATFVELVKAAGLDKDLAGPGPFTVFIPTDEAFKKAFPGPMMDAFKKPEKKAELAKILHAHIVKGKMMKADIEKAKEIKAMEGDFKVEAKDGKVMLDGKANVSKFDIAASNGVIHVVDTVLMPEDKPAPEKKPEMKKEEPKKPEDKKPEPKPEPKKP